MMMIKRTMKKMSKMTMLKTMMMLMIVKRALGF